MTSIAVFFEQKNWLDSLKRFSFVSARWDGLTGVRNYLPDCSEFCFNDFIFVFI